MIQPLTELFQRLDSEGKMPSFGYEFRDIDCAIVIDGDGAFQNFEDLRVSRQGIKKTWLVGKRMTIPRSVIRSSNVVANPLSDDLVYVLGMPNGKQNCKEKMCSFRDRTHEIIDACSHPAAIAVLRLLDTVDFSVVSKHPSFAMATTRVSPSGKVEHVCPRIVFKICLDNEALFLTDIHEVHLAYDRWLNSQLEKLPRGACAISGLSNVPIMTTHGRIHGIGGTNGLSLLSYNHPSFCFEGLEQNNNYPISAKTEFAYVNAMNYLVGHDSRNMVKVGKENFYIFFGSPRVESDLMSYGSKIGETNGTSVEDLFAGDETEEERSSGMDATIQSPRIGRLPADDGVDNFYVFGLTAGQGRLYLRTQRECSVPEMQASVRKFFDSMRIDMGEQPPITISNIIDAATDGKPKSISPSIGVSLMDCAICGNQLPDSLVTASFRRMEMSMRKTGGKTWLDQKWNVMRLGIMRAWYNRNADRKGKKHMNERLEGDTVGFYLGRYLSLCDYLQWHVSGSVTSTISSQMVTGMMASPARYFAILGERVMRTSRSLDENIRCWFEQQFAELDEKIMRLGGIPQRLDDMGKNEFVFGFQMSKLMKSKEMDGFSQNECNVELVETR